MTRQRGHHRSSGTVLIPSLAGTPGTEPMLAGHMPGGARGILSLLTMVFVLPEGECCCNG